MFEKELEVEKKRRDFLKGKRVSRKAFLLHWGVLGPFGSYMSLIGDKRGAYWRSLLFSVSLIAGGVSLMYDLDKVLSVDIMSATYETLSSLNSQPEPLLKRICDLLSWLSLPSGLVWLTDLRYMPPKNED